MIWLLIAQLFIDAPCSNGPLCFRVAFRQIREDTVVILNYPAGAKPTHVCSILYEQATDEEVDRHCWDPKDDRFEFDVWENMRYKGYYFNVELWRDDGTYVRAEPIPDIVAESGGIR